MPKNRFSSLDVSAICSELRAKLVGLRLSNVYDVNSKTFLFKFHKPDEKFSLLIESGIRMHCTDYVRDKSSTPSNFNVKLRKHLKTKRLIALNQINGDRRVDFQFAEGEYAFHLIVEFFATGNIILTDYEYKIMSLMRVVEVAEETPISVGQTYQLENRQEHFLISSDSLMKALSLASPDDGPDAVDSPATSKKHKRQKKKVINLKNVLRTSLGPRYGPALVDHAIALSSVSPDTADFLSLENQQGVPFQSLLAGFRSSDEILAMKVDSKLKGYIMTAIHETNDKETQLSREYAFDEFHPFKPAYFVEDESNQLLEFESFDIAVDEFYSKVETQRLQQKALQAEQHAIKKLEAVKENSAMQIKNFQLSQEKKELMAQAIEFSLDMVDSAIKTICSFVASGMDWGDLEELVNEEREKGNPLALIISGLKLQLGMITLSLPNPDSLYDQDDSDFSGDSTDSEHEEEEDAPLVRKSVGVSENIVVDVNIYESAFSNARSYYGAKKLAIEKGKKTIEASTKQLELAEKKILAALEKSEAKAPTIIKYRPPHWFEKFLWFVSSENYLIVGGRDATQCEILVTKYLKSGDFYVNADIERSACVIVKRLDADAPQEVIPSTTLLQAGTMAICQSKAWESKILTSAFWVTDNQVTKKSLVGDSLQVGVFHIKGKKNYLPPIQLVYGVGLLFQVAEECVEGHRLERKPWARGESSSTSELESKFQSAEINIEQECVNQAAIDLMGSSAIDESPPENPENGEDDNVKGADEDTQELSTEEIHLEIDKEVAEKEVAAVESLKLDEEEEVVSTEGKSPSLATGKKNDPVARGKKGKLRKMNSKYGDQDEEDRELALELLGSNRGPQPKGKKAKALAEKQKQQEERSIIEREKREAKANEKMLKPKRQFTNEKADDEEYLIPDVNLDNLTGTPFEDDLLEYCIPVCAPWICLQKYKYRTKLLPGSQKRGKAAKSAEAFFISQATKSKAVAELELIKQVAEPDWINAMISKVKVVAGRK